MEKNISQEELEVLHRTIRNTISEAIGVMEVEGAYMLEVKKDPSRQNAVNNIIFTLDPLIVY